MDRLSLPVETSIFSLDIEQLLKRAEEYADASVSEATKKAYRTDWKTFSNFCEKYKLSPLPASPETLILFFTATSEAGASVSTLRRRKTSIAAAHNISGVPSPTRDGRVDTVFKGIINTIGAPQKKAKSISWSDLQKFYCQCDNTMIGRRDAAVLLLGWTAALRRSEIVGLNLSDLEILDEGIILTIRRSKTDQEGKGAKIAIPRAIRGTCPVKEIERWIERRTASLEVKDDDPLFPTIGVRGRGKWWFWPKGRMSARIISDIVKKYAKFAGYNPVYYSAHSLRRGMATEAGAQMVPERLISRHTRHRSIEVLRGYIEEGTIWNETPLAAIYPSVATVPRIEETPNDSPETDTEL